MIRPRIFLKIFFSTVVLMALTGLVATWLVTRDAGARVTQDTAERLRAQVQMLYALMEKDAPTEFTPALQGRMRTLAEQTGMRITLIRADGVVLADSHKDPRGMDNHGERPEVLQSIEKSFGQKQRHSVTLGQNMLYVAKAYPDGKTPQLYVRGSQPLTNIENRKDGLRNLVFGAIGIATLFSLLGAVIVARRISEPIRTVAEAATDIARGDYARRVPIRSDDEIADLGRSFNEMAARLEDEVTTIRRDQRELRAILRGMTEGVVAVDTEERVVLMNEAACEILAIEEERAIKRPLWETLRIPAIAATLSAAMKKEETQSSKVRIPQGATDRIVNLHASPLVGEGGARRGAVLVLEDATERERVEAIRRDFIANASHELKTPIASVRGMVETILDDDEMDVGIRHRFLERVLSQTTRLGDIVQEMLALSRLETEGARVATKALDVRLALQGVVEDVLPLAKERGIQLDTTIPTEPCLVLAEPEALRRIVGNLLDNAIKYANDGGTVQMHAVHTGDELTIEVTDDGPGIPTEKHHRIFERFYRVDEGRSRELGGTGLGLAIVKHHVHALGGHIELESAPGQGSTFRVSLRTE